MELSKEEFFELRQCIGEFRRVCRDQVFKYVAGEYLKTNNEINNQRLQIAESLVAIISRTEQENS